MTAWRRPRSAALLVGSTSSISTSVQSAGQSLLRLRQSVFVGASPSASPRSSRLWSSRWSGAISAASQARGRRSARKLCQPVNSRSQIESPAWPISAPVPRPSASARKSRMRCAQQRQPSSCMSNLLSWMISSLLNSWQGFLSPVQRLGHSPA